LKLLFLTDLWLPFPGGAERYVFNLAREMQDRGHSIVVVTGYADAIPGAEGIRIHQAPGLCSNEPWNNRFHGLLKSALEHFNPNVVFTHRYFAEEYSRLTSWRWPVVEIVHQRKHVNDARLTIFNTDYTRKENGGSDRDMVLIPPVCPDRIKVLQHREDMIGFVKPLTAKGADMVYALANRLPDRNFLILRGSWPTVEDIRNLPNVEFDGPRLDTENFYSRCKLILMPSLSETAGTVPLEAAVHGVPCISSNIGGLPETNGGGICLPLDEKQWVEEIDKLDDGDYYRTVVNRQKEYLGTFQWQAKFDQLDREIRSMKCS
jgi:glycosyltransferase involved in cell wall biosynthesis